MINTHTSSKYKYWNGTGPLLYGFMCWRCWGHIYDGGRGRNAIILQGITSLAYSYSLWLIELNILGDIFFNLYCETELLVIKELYLAVYKTERGRH